MTWTLRWLALGTLLVACNAYAWADLILHEISQAKRYCPATSSLLFTGITEGARSTEGFILGTKDGVVFESMQIRAPKFLTPSGYLQKIEFQRNHQGYGMISDKWVTCYYHYTDVLNGDTQLVIKGRLH